ncbi:MAG: nucleotidyltransferase family protein [Chloroflexi bacterium]|nr:nucleotidyltransferase family protein [Chloroflexota bacterium]
MTTLSEQKFEPKIAAVIAAAGQSRRMGSPKQLLPWGDSTVIATVVQNLSAAGAEPVLCVVGHRQAEVTAALTNTQAEIVFNPDYAYTEMLSSYQAGIRHLETTQCQGALIALGDQPHIPVTVIQQVIAQARQTPDQVVIPSYEMRRGHPFYVPRTLWPALLALGNEESLRTLLKLHGGDIVYVNIATDVILRDMDSPADYASLQAVHAAPITEVNA